MGRVERGICTVTEGKAGFQNDNHTWQSGLTNRKLKPDALAVQPPKQQACPECRSERLWRDGLRYANKTTVQRWLCRDCGYRFSQSKVKINITGKLPKTLDSGTDHFQSGIIRNDLSIKESSNDFPLSFGKDVASHEVSTVEKGLNSFAFYNRKRQVCDSDREAKNLAEEATTRQEQAAGATTTTADMQGKIVELLWSLKRDGKSKSTIENYGKYLRLLVKYGANLQDPESVKDTIARQETWGIPSRLLAIAAYTLFASMNNIVWKPPKYKQERKLPFIPLESEIDALISSGGKKMAATLQLLKETGMRIGEACRLKWTDVDLEHNTATMNEPEKGGQPRMFKISARLVAMLNALPKENEYVFGRMKGRDAASYFCYLRRRVANKLQNPRFNSIHLHTFRHWHASLEYHRTKDILYVMRRLGHRRIENTLIYTQLVQFEGDEFCSAVAETVDEAKKLIEAGFDYVCTYEGNMLFRKRK